MGVLGQVHGFRSPLTRVIYSSGTRVSSPYHTSPPPHTHTHTRAQAQKFGGRILLAYESTAAGHVGELSDAWETIAGPEDVQTSAEVYAGLTSQGFAVKYFRVPVTDGTSPAVSPRGLGGRRVGRAGGGEGEGRGGEGGEGRGGEGKEESRSFGRGWCMPGGRGERFLEATRVRRAGFVGDVG